MNTPNLNQIVEKLNSIIVNRFAVSVEYLPLSNDEGTITKERAVALETARRNAGAAMIVAHNQLIVPMRVDGAFVGATRVLKIDHLNPKELAQVKATIDQVLTETIAAHSIFDRMNRALELEIDFPTFSNVIPLSSRSQAAN